MTNWTNDGIRETNIKASNRIIQDLKAEWKKHVQNIKPYPSNFDGKGIVMCAGGLKYFTCAWVSINFLRKNGCVLPIEVWFYGNELSNEIIDELEKLNVKCKNLLDYGSFLSIGYMFKPLAILHSSFKEVLFLDADNVSMKDPAELFSAPEYLEFGAVFWPDYWRTCLNNPIWSITGVKKVDVQEQESGQILINKEKCWKELNLCVYFNSDNEIYYQLLHGDKDTFRFAWLALKTQFFMIKRDLGACGYSDSKGNFYGTTMVQHNFQDELYFFHRNLLKWDITKPDERVWHKIKRFLPDATNKKYKMGRINGHAYMDLEGDIEELDFIDVGGEIENACMEILKELRQSDIYNKFIIYSYYAKLRV